MTGTEHAPSGAIRFQQLNKADFDKLDQSALTRLAWDINFWAHVIPVTSRKFLEVKESRNLIDALLATLQRDDLKAYPQVAICHALIRLNPSLELPAEGFSESVQAEFKKARSAIRKALRNSGWSLR